MSALDYSQGFGPSTSYNQVLMHPVGRSILEQWNALPTDEVERYALASIPLELAVRTAPGLIDDPAAQNAALAELAAAQPIDPSELRREDPVPAPAKRKIPGKRGPARWSETVERYGRFEFVARGPQDGRPYLDVEFSAVIEGPSGGVRVPGFYDAEGIYRLRFMPLEPGTYTFTTSSNAGTLDGYTGRFVATPQHAGSHGPVRADGLHFCYDDGHAYRPIGTTAYAWLHQNQERRARTIETLRNSGFNKFRMCLFPKWFAYNEGEPESTPFVKAADGTYDFTQPDPAFWRELERRVEELANMGVEADLVLFHPYDKWGFEDMGKDTDDRYVRYAVARLASFFNVWWSLANEHDVMVKKTEDDWERLGSLVQASDPSNHLRSIHHCLEFYDHSRPWITHASIQSAEVERTGEWRERWGKPVIIDECGYEGDLQYSWGDITAAELTRRHWAAAVRGGYAGHGETYAHPENEIWWSTGGELRGESSARISFLRRIMDAGPEAGWEPQGPSWAYPTAGVDDHVFISYLGMTQAKHHTFVLSPERSYTVHVIDTWQMTAQTVAQGARGRIDVSLPGRPYMAVRFVAESP